MAHRFSFFAGCLAFCTAVAAQNMIITYTEGGTAEVSGYTDEDIHVSVKGNKVNIKDMRDYENDLGTITYVLKGKTSDGSLKLNSYVKAKVRLDAVDLTSKEGAAIHLKNKKLTEIESTEGTENHITILACKDTAKNKQAAIWAKQSINLTGKGKLNVHALGDGCKGINVKGDIVVRDVNLNVITKGDNLGIDTTRVMGAPQMKGMPPIPAFSHDSIPADGMARFEEMNKDRKHPMNRQHPATPQQMTNLPFPPAGGMPDGKQKYLSTCKGIKAKGKISIESGNVSVETNSAGAEGIEGKEGVRVDGGEIYVRAVDDGINSGGKIVFSGGKTTAISTTNDAIDSNFGEKNGGGFPLMHERSDKSETLEPAIIISGGTVLAWSQRGAPEEGLDCDFSPIEVSGGTVFSIGAGMGDMPSVPTNETAKQATALVIGLDFDEGQKVTVRNKKGKSLIDFDAPFAFQRSSSLISSPGFKVGDSYVLSIGTTQKNIELKEPFTIVNQNNP